MLGSGISSRLAGPTISPAAWTQTRVTSGSLTTASVPWRKSTWIVAPLASERPKAICLIRSPTRAAAASLRVRMVPLSRTCSGMMLALEPPWMEPNVTTTGIARVDRPGHELVDAGDELRRDADRVHRLVRPGGMPSPALDLDLELLAERGEHALAMGDPSRRRVRVDVERDDRPDLLHGTGGDHLERPLADLLGRLEDGPPGRARGEGRRDSARAPGPRPGPCVAWASCPQACITPSRVDRYGTVLASWIRRASMSARIAIDGQAAGILRAGDESTPGRRDRAWNARLLQLLGQESGRLVFLAARLGMGMKLAANLAEHPLA